jgi:hypothetical protein
VLPAVAGQAAAGYGVTSNGYGVTSKGYGVTVVLPAVAGQAAAGREPFPVREPLEQRGHGRDVGPTYCYTVVTLMSHYGYTIRILLFHCSAVWRQAEHGPT